MPQSKRQGAQFRKGWLHWRRTEFHACTPKPLSLKVTTSLKRNLANPNAPEAKNAYTEILVALSNLMLLIELEAV
jgi:hypothetical protein